jgi:hypothetical protein
MRRQRQLLKTRQRPTRCQQQAEETVEIMVRDEQAARLIAEARRLLEEIDRESEE